MGDQSPRTKSRLARTEQELLEATREFSIGASQFGPVDTLNDAVAAMELAQGLLEQGELPGGQAAESEALANLVRARVNLRKMLSDSNSSSSSQCRTFDNQQAQKLRPPKKKEPKEQQEQLAEMREQVEELAQQQREWSEEVRSGSGGAKLEQEPSETPPPNNTSPSNPSSSSSMTKPQLAASDAAQKMREQFNNSTASSPLIDQQMSAAAEEIDESVEKLAEGDRTGAADAAERAADQLESVSEHLAAMNAPDFAQQLSLAQRLAQRLADQQQEVASAMQPVQDDKSGEPGASSAQGAKDAQPSGQESQGGGSSSGSARSMAGQQRELAAATDRLAELLAQLAAKALDEDRTIQDTLDDVRAANSPQDIAETMRDAATELEDGKLAEAASSAKQAESSIQNLAKGLGDARRQWTQPSLEDLVAAEADAAELVEKSKDPDARALADFQAQSLERKLQQLTRRDNRLAAALQKMASSQGTSTSAGAAQGNGGAGNQFQPRNTPEAEGFQQLPTVMGGPVNEVAKVLQERIQEVILDGVTSSSDEAVPLEYREMVERYYKNLSDDLR